VLTFHFCEDENNVISPELSEMNSDFCHAHLADKFTALLAGTLAQIEKQLKLIPYSLSDFKHKA
jgi:hypothetical protein